MKSIFCVLFVAGCAFLSACGGSDDGGGSSSEVDNGGEGSEVGGGDGGDDTIGNGNPGSQTGVASIAGVWDVGETVNGQRDIWYTVIRSNGTGTDLDYLGDSFDNIADCYFREDYTITHNGGDSYTIVFEFFEDSPTDVTITKVDGNLRFEFFDDGIPDVAIYPPAGLTESSLTPICPDDLIF